MDSGQSERLAMPAFTMSTQQIVSALRTSDSTLRRLRREGVLKPGTHFRALGTGLIKPALLWDPVAVDNALAQRSRRSLR
jgi:hypothetical protein